ncbi:MAG: AAA family ATPase [Bacteroidaceae bacterium]|nr:AAA family ATPase [Bacteroidaceae bacterium]
MAESPITILQRQRALLQTEYAYEKEEFQRLTEATGVKRKVERGMAWFPLTLGRSYHNSLDQLVVEVSRSDAAETTSEREDPSLFEPGKPVCFFSEDASGDFHGTGGLLHYYKFVAQVSYVEDDRMVIALPSPDALEQLHEAYRLGVQLYLDEQTYHLMFEALDDVITAKTGRLAELREIFHSTLPCGKFTFDPVRFPWLNTSQQAAVNEVLWAKDVAVVHGPPGTGKTTTLVEAIYETLRRENQVLVCAQSNMAVDWIAEKLVDRGVSVLRIGNPTRVTDKMLSFTYERRFESHPSYQDLWAIRRTIRQLYDSNSGSRENRHQKIARLKDRATDIEYTINQALFADAKVIACTLAGSANRLLMGMKFGTLFIDEAAQALEAACWIAIRKAHRIIFAGDHRQLPPTIKSPEAMHGGLDKTLMQYIVEQKPQAVSLLTVQYRMCDAIMQFPNREFYGGQLTSAPEVKYRGILDWDTAIEWVDSRPTSLPLPVREGSNYPTGYAQSSKLRDKADAHSSHLTPLPNEVPRVARIVEVDLMSSSPSDRGFARPWSLDTSRTPNLRAEMQGSGSSWFNVAEAQLTLATLQRYFEKIGKERLLEERVDVGVISPYKGQVNLLRRMLRQDSYWKPFRSLITVNTVDGFQGQERDVIVISLVRSNDQGDIGFLRDLRRMNVAITRARMKLIILGDKNTICRMPFYKRLADYIDETY